jgi:hypothetical protein
MRKVEFVRIKSELIGYGLGKGTKYGFDRVEEIIKERIENGWDYCGYVPIETRGTGDIETMSLVFQKNE